MNDASALKESSVSPQQSPREPGAEVRVGEGEAGFVAAVERRLRQALLPGQDADAASVLLSDASTHLTLADAAKRARPRLLWYFAQALGERQEHVNRAFAARVDFAVVAELIHTASLMHDDVLDEATLRRGSSSRGAPGGSARPVWGRTVGWARRRFGAGSRGLMRGGAVASRWSAARRCYAKACECSRSTA